MKNLQILTILCNFEFAADIADKREIGEEEMAVFLLNEVFCEGVLGEKEYFTLLHAEYHNN